MLQSIWVENVLLNVMLGKQNWRTYSAVLPKYHDIALGKSYSFLWALVGMAAKGLVKKPQKDEHLGFIA